MHQREDQAADASDSASKAWMAATSAAMTMLGGGGESFQLGRAASAQVAMIQVAMIWREPPNEKMHAAAMIPTRNRE
jgi:hypothetical protein